MEIVSIKEAKEAGRNWYFTGQPCRRGHVCQRLVSNRACVECRKENGRQWRNRECPDQRRSRRRQHYRTAKAKGKDYVSTNHYASDEVVMFHRAKQRARLRGIPFTITLEDIFIPERCPIFDCVLVRNKGGKRALPNSPSLDRIVPERGYVPGNVRVICFKANTIKSNATKDELYKVWASMC